VCQVFCVQPAAAAHCAGESENRHSDGECAECDGVSAWVAQQNDAGERVWAWLALGAAFPAEITAATPASWVSPEPPDLLLSPYRTGNPPLLS